jgi:hypothetical protein
MTYRDLILRRRCGNYEVCWPANDRSITTEDTEKNENNQDLMCQMPSVVFSVSSVVKNLDLTKLRSDDGLTCPKT